MGYAENLLSTGERITHREKQHWFVFVWGARYTILAIVIAAIGAVLQVNLSSPWKEFLGWAAAILFIGGLLLLGWTILRYINQEYVLTNRRVIQVEGVLNKKVTDSSLEKVNDVVLTQSVFGRMFGFGDLEVLTASESGISKFRMLVEPVRFKRAMLDAKHEYEHDLVSPSYAAAPPLRSEPAGAPVATAEPPTDDTVTTSVAAGASAVAAADQLTRDEVTRTLNSLADLRDRGAISAEEYERKKADLLARL
jgi:uncharacterized membrane protein YdbT with pleckstrin-like domain